jgi:carboxymethylenebutenolidase
MTIKDSRSDPITPIIDPTRTTSDDLNRRTFVSLSAAAAVSGPISQATARAAVDENDPSITVARPNLRRPDTEIGAYAAWPVQARANVPSVVVIMHVWGVDTTIRETVRRLAKAGFAAIAPDLYARFDAPSGDGVTDIDVMRPYAKQLDPKQYNGDIRAAALWLMAKFPASKVGIIGFCMGGHVALVAAVDNSDQFTAVCPFYGPLTDIDPASVTIPICGSYGARDKSIPPEQVRAFRDALHVPNDIQIYDNAGHAFADDNRASYVPAAANDAWRRTIAFLSKYLGEPQ